MSKKRTVYLRRHLMVRGEYARLLLMGVKRATIRLGKVVPRYEEVIIHSWGRPIAKARVVRTYYKRVKELGDEEARLDGFRSREELIRELKRVYGDISGDDLVTVIELEIIQRLDELVSEDPYYGLKPQDIARLALRYLREELGAEERSLLNRLARGESIRQVAMKTTGSPTNRRVIRRVLRKSLSLLVKKGVIHPPDTS